MAVTLKDIARETGLSVATISKYINGATLKEKNRIAVEQAIRKLDYRVNEYARGLKSNRSRTIGVVIPELSNLFIATIISHMEEELRARGYSIVICDCHSKEKLEVEAVQFLMSKMVDGIINMPTCKDGRHLLPAVEKGRPIVLIDRQIPQLHHVTNGVFIKNEDAAYDATQLLLEQGHRRIGIIVGPCDVYTSQSRLRGYCRALQDRGISCDENLIAYSDYSIQSGYECAKALLDGENDMSALFITNYELTIGAVIAFNELQIQIPKELSVIGFDNQDLSRIVHPKLTIVTQPLQEMGHQAARIMLEQLAGTTPGIPVTISLPAAVLPGASVSAWHEKQ